MIEATFRKRMQYFVKYLGIHDGLKCDTVVLFNPNFANPKYYTSSLALNLTSESMAWAVWAP